MTTPNKHRLIDFGGMGGLFRIGAITYPCSDVAVVQKIFEISHWPSDAQPLVAIAGQTR